MAIEIYSKAKVVKKDNNYYFLLKSGSKNTFFAPQIVIDDDLRDKRICGGRAIEWRIIAVGNEENAKNIALTSWNAPTGSIYGRIDFGDKLNIALWFFKNINKAIDYNSLDYIQKQNFDSLLSRYNSYKAENPSHWQIDLANISDRQAFSSKHEYCGKEYSIAGNSKTYKGFVFWQLNNL